MRARSTSPHSTRKPFTFLYLPGSTEDAYIYSQTTHSGILSKRGHPPKGHHNGLICGKTEGGGGSPSTYRMYRLRSWSFTMLATCCFTYSGSTTITFSTEPSSFFRSITGSGGASGAVTFATTPSSVASERGLLNRSGAWKLI